MNTTTFEAVALAAPIQKALAKKGYTEMSPIQAQAIPVLLEGHDLMACAQTGTGKTAAFALPILHQISGLRRRPQSHEIRALILTPTRELAVQVAESFKTYGSNIRLQVGLVYGGVSQNPQIRNLQKGLDILVATPGRLLDLHEQGYVDFSAVEFFVLDEADRMLDMGFIGDIRRIAGHLPKDRQTLLFSATFAPEIKKLAADLLHEPENISIAPDATTAERVDHRVLFIEKDDKQNLLLDLIKDRAENAAGERTLVFSRTRHGARRLAEKIKRAGISVDAIHGDKTQAARQKTIDSFRDGRIHVLVATDVAARGLDVKNITLVVNFDLPMEADNYVHRIGRTARAGNSGYAISFCSNEELPLLRQIERFIRQKINVEATHKYHSEKALEAYQSGRDGSGPRRRSRSRPRRRQSASRSKDGQRNEKPRSSQPGNKPTHKRRFNRRRGNKKTGGPAT
ncbi:MAG: DEAD/DEAH box helicase [Chthoniobacterales bacterium]